MLAAALIAGGAAFGAYLLGTIKPLPSRPSTPAPPTAPIVSCQLGNLLIYPNCYPLQRGNIDLTLNTDNKFSTQGEYANIYVVSGSVKVTYLYNNDIKWYRAGQTFSISANNIVAAMEPNTKLQKRVW